jgi:drug/metabolite transporter (DMT)-like permease
VTAPSVPGYGANASHDLVREQIQRARARRRGEAAAIHLARERTRVTVRMRFLMTATTRLERQRALWMLLLANFYWGLSFPVIKSVGLLHGVLLPEAGTWFSAIYTVAPRFLLALAIMALWQPRAFVDISRPELKQGVIIGLFAAAGMLFQTDGLQFTAASTSAFLTQLYAILIPVYLALRARRNPGGLVWICCTLVLIGVAVLGRFDWHALRFGRGEAETLLSSLFFMGQILWLEKKEFAGNRPERITIVMFATEALIFWTCAVCTAPSAGALLVPWTSLPWLGLTLLLAVFCTVGSFMLMNRWQPKITATEAGLIYCVEPIFASLMAAFLPGLFSIWAGIHYPNERATWILFVGGGLITLANVLLQLKPPPKE